jgi:hypothetical protein
MFVIYVLSDHSDGRVNLYPSYQYEEEGEVTYVLHGPPADREDGDFVAIYHLKRRHRRCMTLHDSLHAIMIHTITIPINVRGIPDALVHKIILH